jgi:hypothetical protein
MVTYGGMDATQGGYPSILGSDLHIMLTASMPIDKLPN